MSRAAPARCPLTAGQLGLLAISRRVPERTVLELATASEGVGDPVRVALFHFQQCADCLAGSSCDRGAGLIEGCHGYRHREERQ